MDNNDYINYWLETADQDYKTMLNLYESGDYHWSLFIGHLVIEKLLKALHAKTNFTTAPKTHDLLRLAQNLKIEMTEEQMDHLDTITTFNINARYPDYKKYFYLKCDQSFTKININIIEELRKWLKLLIATK